MGWTHTHRKRKRERERERERECERERQRERERDGDTLSISISLPGPYVTSIENSRVAWRFEPQKPGTWQYKHRTLTTRLQWKKTTAITDGIHKNIPRQKFISTTISTSTHCSATSTAMNVHISEDTCYDCYDSCFCHL
ncbi:hypothetical protein FHG87_010750 [Trinorchestia longiramus]|nr:hypothetical protein FHG87_010750 [Trinorchestia longiramus]